MKCNKYFINIVYFESMKKGNVVKYGFIFDSWVFNVFSNIYIKDSCLIIFLEGFDRCYFGV